MKVVGVRKDPRILNDGKCSVEHSNINIDNRKYCSGNQCGFNKANEIQLEPTVAYSLQQNEVAEKFSLTLVEKEKVRTILTD